MLTRRGDEVGGCGVARWFRAVRGRAGRPVGRGRSLKVDPRAEGAAVHLPWGRRGSSAGPHSEAWGSILRGKAVGELELRSKVAF